MIKTENEYFEAKKRLKEEFKMIDEHKVKLKNSGLSTDQIKLAVDPLLSFACKMKEEVEEYERLKCSDID